MVANLAVRSRGGGFLSGCEMKELLGWSGEGNEGWEVGVVAGYLLFWWGVGRQFSRWLREE